MYLLELEEGKEIVEGDQGLVHFLLKPHDMLLKLLKLGLSVLLKTCPWPPWAISIPDDK
jgi:hypothetical protein